MNLSAIILAAGASRRMGSDKAWLEWNGKPLLHAALEKVREIGVEEVFVSGRPGEDYRALRCPVLFDREAGLGPLGGIERGLGECTSPLLLVLAVDMPRMTSVFLRRLAASCDRLTGVVPRLGDNLEPLAAIYPKRCQAIVLDSLARCRRAARDFASACLEERVVRALDVSSEDAGCFANCNRPEDLGAVGAAI